MKLPIRGIDHVAATVADIEKSFQFYADVLGARSPVPPYSLNGKVAVRTIVFGGAMLNLHQAGNGVSLVARVPTVGAVDICFRWDDTIEAAVAHLAQKGVAIIEGPVRRVCSDGTAGQSVYFHDLDGNLLELLSTVETP